MSFIFLYLSFIFLSYFLQICFIFPSHFLLISFIFPSYFLQIAFFCIHVSFIFPSYSVVFPSYFLHISVTFPSSQAIPCQSELSQHGCGATNSESYFSDQPCLRPRIMKGWSPSREIERQAVRVETARAAARRATHASTTR